MIPIEPIRFTIEQPPRSKKNSMQILVNPKTKRPFVSPSSAYKAYRKAALMLIPKDACIGIDYPINVKCVFYMQTRRKVDLSNLISAISDILVDANVVVDDNRDVIASNDGSRVYYDKDRPRVEIEITRAESDYVQWKEMK